MNIFKGIQGLIERETGLVCVYEQPNIEDNQVMVSIREIEKTGVENQYKVTGLLTIQLGMDTGWKVLTQILDLEIVVGMRASAIYTNSKEGFSTMSMEFSHILNKEEKRIFPIKTVNIKELNDVSI